MLNMNHMEKDNGTKSEQIHPTETVSERMELLIGYLVVLRGQGLTLSGEEGLMLKTWIEAEPDFGQLLAVVDELATRYFAQKTLSGRGKSISGLSKRILKALEQRQR